MYIRRAGPVVAALVAVLLTTTACADAGDDAVGAADRFYAALAEGDGAVACETLAPQTREEVAQAAGKPCEQAILEEDVPTVGEPRQVSSFGTSAQVRYDGDTTFLARFDSGWRVTSAACTRETSGRYDCRIQGG